MPSWITKLPIIHLSAVNLQWQEKVVRGSLYNTSAHDSSTKVRFVCVSDTHGEERKINYPMPEGDVLLHAGSFSKVSLNHDMCL